MKKLRSDSKWHQLPLAQREEVLNWMFDEGLAYREVLQRAKKNFGVEASISSLRRYYHHVAEERDLGQLVSAQGSLEDFRKAAAKIIGAAGLQIGSGAEPHHTVRRLLPLMRLLLKEKLLGLAEQRLKHHRGRAALASIMKQFPSARLARKRRDALKRLTSGRQPS